jgi:hypothetical protein
MGFIRKAGYVNVDNAQCRMYGYGGFIANDETKAVGSLTAQIGANLFIGKCVGGSVSAGFANLVFNGLVGKAEATVFLILDEPNKSCQLILDIASDENSQVIPVTVGGADLDKAWEYIRVLIQ